MSVDFRQFLQGSQTRVLPYLGGTRVDAPDRPLRLAAPVEPGWWRFRVDGRRATAVERAAPIDLSDRPARRGHWARGWIFASGRDVDRVALPPEEEPPPLARVTARRWPSGDLLFDSLDFEDDAELAAREALERHRPLGDVKGVAPSLRAAFGYALAWVVGRELSIPVSPREVAAQVLAIADGGRDVAAARLRELAAERERHRIRTQARRVEARPRGGSPEERADAALAAARCRLLGSRSLRDGQLEVRWEIEGARIISVVDAATLHVYDAGVCLAGADEELTLDSLPSVIREAIETDQLNITRHG